MAIGRITNNFDLQIMDANGTAPLANGKLYFYTAGTVTPKNTYPTEADAIAGTNANANPVILNSAGRPSSSGNIINIWLLADEMYDITIKTSADVTIRTIEDYSGAYEPLNESSSADLQFADNTGLQDSNSNEVLDILKTTSAVNYFTMQNAATGNPPKLRSAGDDSNVGLTIDTKGTGVITLDSNVAATGTMAVTGTLTAAATTITGTLSVTDAVSFSSTVACGAITDSSTLSVSGATTCAAVTASGTVTCNGALTVGNTAMTIGSSNTIWATQTNQETATSTATIVSPGRQHFHPSAAKAWGVINNGAALQRGYNIASLVDSGTGLKSFNFTTAMSDAAYCAITSAHDTGGSSRIAWSYGKAVGSVDVAVSYDAGTLSTATHFQVAIFGDI